MNEKRWRWNSTLRAARQQFHLHPAVSFDELSFECLFCPAKKRKKGVKNQDGNTKKRDEPKTKTATPKKETPEEKDPPLLGIQTLLRQDTFRSAHEYDVEGHDSSWIDLTDGGEIGPDERSRNTLLFPLLLFKAAFFEILSRAAQASQQAEFSSFLLLGGTIRETQHRYKE